MKHLIVTVALAFGLSAGGALAQDPAAQQEALAHNEASNTAFEAGDPEAGMREAEAAWRAAERGWGDNPNTAELAMLVTVGHIDLGNPAAAREAAARTVELAPHAQSYTEAEARLWHGMSLVGDPGQRAAIEAGLAGMEAAGAVSEDVVRGRLTLAALQLGGGDPQTAAATAQQAVEDARVIESPMLRSHLFELGKLQYLAGQFGPAAFTLAESLNMWEEQRPGDLPKPLADTLAWQTIAGQASRRSMEEAGAPAGGPGGGMRGGFGGGFGGFAPAWNFLPQRSNCSVEYQGEIPPLPRPEGDRATLGAAVVLFDIADDGRSATNIRIVGSAPGMAQYEQEIVQRIADRTARRNVRSACRAGRIETIQYEY